MKIAILTFHDASNYGAVMQAFATFIELRKYSEKVFFIEYTNKHRRSIYRPLSGIYAALKKLELVRVLKLSARAPGVIYRNHQFAKFRRENLVVSKRCVSDEDLAQTVADCDLVVIGSDQVWNPRNNGLDLNYYGRFLMENKNSLSYASSFGCSSLERGLESDARRALKKLSFVSTREDIGREMLANMGIADVKVVADPVLCFEDNEWLKMLRISGSRVLPADLFLYVNSNVHRGWMERTEVWRSAKRRVCFGSFRLKDFFDRQISINSGLGPKEFVASLSQAKFIATSSYHATLFSIIFRRNFVVFLSGDKGRDSRILFILEQLGLENRVANETNLDRLAASPPVYDQVVIDRLRQLVERNKSFLSHAMRRLML